MTLMTLSKQELSSNKRGRFTRRVAVLHVLGILLVGFTLSSTASAQNVLRFIPSEIPVASVSSNVTLDLELEFSDVTAGGGIEVTYDASRLTFISFQFSTEAGAPDASEILVPRISS